LLPQEVAHTVKRFPGSVQESWPPSSCWSGQPCLARWPALHDWGVFTMRKRPACNFVLAGQPDIFFPPHVIEDAIEHADGRRTRTDPVM
jgi:hypothetical protein